VHRKNKSKQDARLTNSWLLGLRVTPLWGVLTSTSGQQFNEIGIIAF